MGKGVYSSRYVARAKMEVKREVLFKIGVYC